MAHALVRTMRPIWSEGGNITNHSYPGLEGILTIVDDIQQGKVILPEFQRNFVWANQDIKELLVSILNGYFIFFFREPWIVFGKIIETI